MSGPGFDWLNITGLDSHSSNSTPAPPVSFGVSKSSSSVNVVSDNNVAGESATGSFLSVSNIPSRSNSIVSVEAEDDSDIPLSLKLDDLSQKEAKTYIRWYNNIITRKGTKTIKLDDVFQFLSNFKLNHDIKTVIARIFIKHIQSLNIGQFFALLRLISHSLDGQLPRLRLIKVEAPIPSPISILSRKRQTEDESEDEAHEEPESSSNPFSKNAANNTPATLDLDSFSNFLLTGQRPDQKKPKKKLNGKRVKFSDQIVTDIAPDSLNSVPEIKLDMSLPMDQLLGKVGVPTIQPPEEDDEEELLKDMEESMNHFQNVNVDSVSIHGVPSNIPSVYFDHTDSPQSLDSRASTPDMYQQQQASARFPQALKPNMTGPAQMAQLFSNPNNPGAVSTNNYSHDSLTNGNTLLNSNQDPYGRLSPNPAVGEQTYLQPALTGSVPRQTSLLTPPVPVPRNRIRSVSSPMAYEHSQQINNNSTSPRIASPLGYNTLASIDISNSASPNHTSMPPPVPPPRGRSQTLPPPPPPSRRRTASNGTTPPPPLPPKISLGSEAQLHNGYSGYTPNSMQSNEADILGDLRVLEAELDMIKQMTGNL